MAGGIKAKFEGGRELKRALRKLPDATAKNTARRGMKKALQPVADAARAHVPQDDSQLHDSIVVSTKLSKANRRDRKRFGKDDIEVFAGPGPLPHAHLIEFGWEDGDAQPYMRPAWDRKKRVVLEMMKAHLWQEVRKATERAARKAAKARARGR